ncbi:MAG: hypothetical protein ABI678_12790, partial [Kofleriaceae bacterium]
TPGKPADATIIAQRRTTLEQVGAAVIASSKELALEKYIPWAKAAIHDAILVQKIVRLVGRVVAEVAIMVASMQLAEAGIAAARGVMLGLELAEDVRGAGFATRIATSLVGAGLNTIGNVAIDGHLTWKAFAENAVAMTTMTTLMAPFEGLVSESARLENELRTFAQKALRSSSYFVLETATSYAGTIVGQASTNDFTITTPVGGEVIEQAFTMLVGKVVHQHATGIGVRLDTAATRLGKDAVRGLRDRVRALDTKSGKSISREQAVKLLEERASILRDEKSLYDGHPELLKLTQGEPKLGDKFADVPIVLSHLEVVVEGTAYRGTREQIDDAVALLASIDLKPERLADAEHGIRRYRVGERTFDFQPSDLQIDHWPQARAALLADRVPKTGWLLDTKGNRDGVIRLGDIHRDTNLPATVRSEFLAELRNQTEGLASSPQDLFKMLKDLAHSSPEKYLRKGPRIPDAEYVRDTLGGLQRAMSLKACAMIVTPEFYMRASDVPGSGLPEHQGDLKWANAQVVVDLIRDGRVSFNPAADLRQDALVKGFMEGSSGWYFSGADAREAVGSPKELQIQLAVGTEYGDGYVILELNHEVAAPSDRNAAGARRPTALDLTLAPEGKLNPNVDEPVGRTNPLRAGEKELREVVMPPIPLSQISKRTYIRGGAS